MAESQLDSLRKKWKQVFDISRKTAYRLDCYTVYLRKQYS